MLNLAKPNRWIVGCITFAGIVYAACRTGAATPNRAEINSTPTAAYAECPAAGGFSGEVRGRFSVDCIRSLFPFQFYLPDLGGGRYEPPVFGLLPTQLTDFQVQYEPKRSGDPRLLLMVYPKSAKIGYLGSEARSPNGHPVYVGQNQIGFGGSWDDDVASYVLILPDLKEDPARREMILTIADAVIDRQPVR